MAMPAAIMMVMVISSKSAEAATYTWSSYKSPGSTTINTKVVDIPTYKGKMTFRVNSLSGDCSYLVATAKSTEENYYYINTTSKMVKISIAGGEQNFIMSFINSGELRDEMHIKCSIEHNATIDKYLTGSGTISY